jgi:fimbrial isopeptide formation D2 family protein
MRTVATAVTVVLTTSFIAAFGVASPAAAAPVYEITADWAAGTPTQVATGDVINSEWRVNVNDDAPAPSNEPVPDVTFTVTATHGTIVEIPDACLTTGVTPVSSISPDGVTLTCNVGPVHMGTAAAVQVPIVSDGVTGDRVSLLGDIQGVQASPLPEIPIQNTFGMDIRWGSANNVLTYAAGYVDVPLQWTLSMNKGSDPGPANAVYNLTVAAGNGSATSVAPAACSAFTGTGAIGHPWSTGTHAADQVAPFVQSCTLVSTGANTYQLRLTGINYARTQVPTRDSTGRALPLDQDAIASGQITIRVNTTTATTVQLTSTAPTYVAPSGQRAVDDASNNTSAKTILFPGGWASVFNRNEGYMNTGGSSWTDDIRVSPGTTIYQQANGTISQTETASSIGTCSVLDTRFVSYESLYTPRGWNAALTNPVYAWYVGNDATVNPSSASYNPANFNCGLGTGWTTTEPADKSLVKAVRLTLPVAQNRGLNYGAFVMGRLKDNVPVGQDVWQFGNYAENNVWQPYMANGGGMQYDDTPGSRYPSTTPYRDVLRVISATPFVQKVSDRDSVKPGEPANYTLTYSANGAGSIPPTVNGYRLVDTLPVGLTYVPGSATPAPQVTTNASGQQVLTWTLNGVTTNAAHTLTYQAVAAGNVTPGSVLTNTVTATYGGQTRDASESVTVSTNGYTQIGKTTDQWFIANPDGDGSGESGSWTVTVRSLDPLPSAYTDTIDILPYNGDGRGTDYAGTYDVTSVNVPAGATVYYTTADPATLSDDPRTASNGSAPGTIAGNTVGWSTTPVPNPTAIRVIAGRLAPGASLAFTVSIEPDGAEPGDVYVNRAQSIAQHTELVMRTSEPLTMGTMYSVSLKKYVQDRDGNWVDANDAAEYPSFRDGENVNYRVVVTNTGQGTLRDLVVADDKQPQLGSFEIDELLPGAENAEVHEYTVTLGDGGADSIVNNACVSAPQPADTEDPVQTSCDPAGIVLDGDPEHEKTLVSATPTGNGQWTLVYDIAVTNLETHPTSYDLDDTLRFTDEATIVSAAVTAAPAGVTLATPAWNGVGNKRIASTVPLLGSDDAGYAPHHYAVTVVAEVPLFLPGAGTADDPTQCGADGDATARAFTNTTTLTDPRGDTDDDWACAPIPSISIAKSVSEGPVANGDGTWTVTYDIVATNAGKADGVYNMTDKMTADGDLVVESGQVITTPAGVTASAGWTGLGPDQTSPENVIATGVNLPAGGTHTYQVEVVLSVDDAAGVPVVTSCDAAGGGLSNTAQLEHNDLTADADACISVAYITVDKTIASGPTPNGDGTWTVEYEIVAENISDTAGEYDVYDQLRFGDGIDIVSTDTSGPAGVTVLDSWTGLGATPKAAANLLAENETLEGGDSHTYRVEVVVEMDEATIDPAELACPVPGSGGTGGLANGVLLDHNGIEPVDEVCPGLPLIDVDKSISSGPTANDDGTWTITYDLVATNRGAAEGDYDIADDLQFGDGIVIESADVITSPAGVTVSSDWDGLDETSIATDVPLGAGAAHTYQVQAVVSLDLDTVTPDSLTCTPGSAGGLANSVTLTHNGEDRTDADCAPLPLIGISKSVSGDGVTPVDGQDGVYDVTYAITVTNSGPGAGVYNLDDVMTVGDGVTVLGVQSATTDAPNPVGINPAFLSGADDRIVTGQPITGAASGTSVVHTYLVTIRYSLDLAEVGNPIADGCFVDGEPAAGTLSNTATVAWNGITDEDDACVIPGRPLIDKEFVSATPAGNGQWDVLFDLTVSNTGNEVTSYDLDDDFRFAPVISVDSVTSVTGPAGVAIDPDFDGDTNPRIATDVDIAGLDDAGYAPHVYRVAVRVNAPLHFDPAEADGTGAPGCTVPSGNNSLEQGLNNAATLTDPTGNTQTDTDCGQLPSWDITKTMNGAPVQGANGQWTVNYTVTVVNDGAAAGEYTVTDRLRYGTGIEVISATVSSAPAGVTPSAAWTGRGGNGSDANVIAAGVPLGAGGTHTYQVRVVAELHTSDADATAITCPAPGSDGNGGFANTAGVTHNDLTDTASACAVPEWPKGTPQPLSATGLALAWGIPVGALTLLIMGGFAVWFSVRRRQSVPAGE